MADQQRWFKLWCSAPADDHLQCLPPGDRWGWAAFGAYTKLHGTRGVVRVSPTNKALAAEMGVTVKDLIPTLKRLPHLCVSGSQDDYGTVTVTWDNWVKYQEDTTQAERQKRSRAKKRREEMRKDSTTKLDANTSEPISLSPSNGEPARGDYTAVVERLGARLKEQP